MQSYITYDKEKLNVLSREEKKIDPDIIKIDVSEEKLYRLFQKGKKNWNQDDTFLFKAASEFMHLFVEKLIEYYGERIKDTDTFHYVYIVPSEWEEEVREALIRPLFVQANLISKDDHQDRFLFCSHMEAICYSLTDPSNDNYVTMTRNTILGRIEKVKRDVVLIKLDLISIGNPLFNFSGSVMFSKTMSSNSISLTSDDVKNGIRESIKIKWSIDAQEEMIENIMKEFSNIYSDKTGDKDEVYYLKRPFVNDKSISELDKQHEVSIKSILPFDICEEISKTLTNNLKNLLPIGLAKEYSILKVTKESPFIYSSKDPLENWSRYLLEYNRISFGSNSIVPKKCIEIDDYTLMNGALRYLFDALQNSDIYSKPRILPSKNSVTSSSIFLESKPDAIMNIDISLESTKFSFSLLDENGLVKNIRDHHYFVDYTRLHELESNLDFLEGTTLNAKHSFLAFIEKYLKNDSDFLSDNNDTAWDKNIIDEMESILCREGDIKDLIVSIQQQPKQDHKPVKHYMTYLKKLVLRRKDVSIPVLQHDYFKVFVEIYLAYIKGVISSNLSSIIESNADIKIGYAITIEKIVLKRLFKSQEDLQDMIYASGLLKRDDSSKKLRITLKGEGLLPIIQKYFKLTFPIKSFFVVAQLFKSYIQLTLNQVITEDEQETIIIQDEIIHIPNIYESLSLNMWNNIVEDNSLVRPCNMHNKCNDCELLEIFSLENQAEFADNFKQYMFKNILHNHCLPENTEETMIQLSKRCDCRIYLTVRDIIEVSFRPVIQNIISLVSNSLINKQLFGKYRNIQYMFHLIHFNYNLQFQHILVRVLEDEAEYFSYEQGIDILQYSIPELAHQLFQPVLQQKPCLYKAFQVGVLNHVYSENYGFKLNLDSNFGLKNKRSDSKIAPIDSEIVVLLFEKGNSISQVSRVFYLITKCSIYSTHLKIDYCKLKITDTLQSHETAAVDITEVIPGIALKDNSFPLGWDVSHIVSVVYEGHMSTLSLRFRRTGEEIKMDDLITLGEPMTLARF